MKIKIMDNHDLAYEAWVQEEIKNATLVHIDAHIDFEDMTHNSYIHIGNFLAYAFRERMYEKFIWVIPTPSFNNPYDRKRVLEILSRDFKIQSTDINGIYASTKNAPNHPLIVTCMEYLKLHLCKECVKAVYVDIDIDFFCNPHLRYLYSNTDTHALWTTAAVLYRHITSAIYPQNIITISRSINGGFTPLLYTFLADQLEDILINQGVPSSNRYECLLRGIQCFRQTDWETGLDLFCIAAKEKMDIASQIGILYGLVGLCRYEEAQYVYSHILPILPESQHRYLFPVNSLIGNKDWIGAENMLETWLKIVPKDPWAVMYKIIVLIAKGVLAESAYQPLFDLLSDESTAYQKQYLLARYHYLRGEYAKAILSCEAVLDYLKQGETPFWASQISSFESKKNKGVILVNCYELLAHSFSRCGDSHTASRYARMCKRLGYIDEVLNRLIISISD